MKLRVAGIDLETRAMERTDRGFVASRWMHRIHRAHVDAMLAQSRVVVWCSSASRNTLHAFVALAGPVLLFAFTVDPLRERGLVREAYREERGEYPDKIECAAAWPWPSERFTRDARRAA